MHEGWVETIKDNKEEETEPKKSMYNTYFEPSFLHSQLKAITETFF